MADNDVITKMNDASSDTVPPAPHQDESEVMAVMEVEDGASTQGDTVRDATPQWLRRFPMCIQRILYITFCIPVGLIAPFLLAPYMMLYHLWDADMLHQTYLVDYQQDGTQVEAIVIEQHREVVQVVHIEKDGYLVTVEYEEQKQDSALEHQGAITWRKMFRFRTLEQVETAMTTSDSSDPEGGPRTMRLCYPPGQPQAALPMTSVQNSVEYLSSTPESNKAWTFLKDAGFIVGVHFYFLFFFSGFNGDFLMTGLFWIILLVWTSANFFVVVMLYFGFGLSPVKLHTKLVCKSAERVHNSGEETWEDEPQHDSRNNDTSLTAPLLSAVTGF